MAQRVTKDFFDIELLPIEYHGRNYKTFIDVRIVKIAQRLRDQFGSITVNDKYLGGNYNLSGWRPFDTKIGASFSAHKFGRGLDLKFNLDLIDPIAVQAYIIQNEAEFIKLGLTRMENAHKTITWLHIDCTFTGSDKIVIFNP